MEQMLLDVERGVADRGGLQPVAQRLVVQVDPGARPVEGRRAARPDTVFGPEVDVRVKRRGQRLEGPGISDNARGLAALVAVAEALVATGVPTTRPILFAATVGEEGSGDLRGVKYLLNGKRETGNGKPVAFIAVDGAGLERVIHRALGSKRYHVTFRGPGGHSWAAFGVANPANAVGRAAALLADLPIVTAPRTTCAVVGLGGGTGLNSIPQDAWLDLDLRSEDPRALAQLDVTVRAALARLTTEWYENVEGALGIVRALLVTAAMAEVG